MADVTSGFQRPVSSSEFKAARQRLDALERRDAEKRALAEAKNALEAYIYAMKDKVGPPPWGGYAREMHEKVVHWIGCDIPPPPNHAVVCWAFVTVLRMCLA